MRQREDIFTAWLCYSFPPRGFYSSRKQRRSICAIILPRKDRQQAVAASDAKELGVVGIGGQSQARDGAVPPYVHRAPRGEVVEPPYLNVARFSTGDERLAPRADKYRVEPLSRLGAAELLSVDGDYMQATVAEMGHESAIRVDGQFVHGDPVPRARLAHFFSRGIDVERADEFSRPDIVYANGSILRSADDDI